MATDEEIALQQSISYTNQKISEYLRYRREAEARLDELRFNKSKLKRGATVDRLLDAWHKQSTQRLGQFLCNALGLQGDSLLFYLSDENLIHKVEHYAEGKLPADGPGSLYGMDGADFLECKCDHDPELHDEVKCRVEDCPCMGYWDTYE